MKVQMVYELRFIFFLLYSKRCWNTVHAKASQALKPKENWDNLNVIQSKISIVSDCQLTFTRNFLRREISLIILRVTIDKDEEANLEVFIIDGLLTYD